MAIKDLKKFQILLFNRIYRPIKPILNPLVRKIKIWHVLTTLIVLMVGGSLINGWSLSSLERASYWPWLSKTHLNLSLFWFEVGDEKKALDELSKANKWLFIKTSWARESLIKAEEKVLEPERIRDEIRSWEKILEERPYFRDVLLRLSILCYQVYEDDKAKEYFTKAEYLDPNNEEVLKVKEVISSL
jgi:tetratricopeptide (TPR) repeat protein